MPYREITVPIPGGPSASQLSSTTSVSRPSPTRGSPEKPSVAPPKALLDRLAYGHVLREGELERLRAQARAAASLEQMDPNFARAARKERAERQEEQRVRRAHKSWADKEGRRNGENERLAAEAAARKANRDAQAEANRRHRQQHWEEDEWRRQKVLERIAIDTQQRRVKATIREAFARQIRIEHAPPRTYFTDVEADNIDAPGPGSYQPALPEGKTSSFFPHPTEPSRVPRPEDDGPGPASYDPKPPPTIAYSLGSRAAFDTDKAVARTTAHESPGPAAYDIRVSEKLLAQRGSSLDVTDSGEHKCTFGIPRAKGGMVDVAIARAKLTPGPGQYLEMPDATENARAITLGGRNGTEWERELNEARRRPGPASYTLPPAHVRGGVMGAARRAMSEHVERRPGPGVRAAAAPPSLAVAPPSPRPPLRSPPHPAARAAAAGVLPDGDAVARARDARAGAPGDGARRARPPADAREDAPRPPQGRRRVVGHLPHRGRRLAARVVAAPRRARRPPSRARATAGRATRAPPRAREQPVGADVQPPGAVTRVDAIA